jgi:hypothetical protein
MHGHLVFPRDKFLIKISYGYDFLRSAKIYIMGTTWLPPLRSHNKMLLKRRSKIHRIKLVDNQSIPHQGVEPKHEILCGISQAISPCLDHHTHKRWAYYVFIAALDH